MVDQKNEATLKMDTSGSRGEENFLDENIIAWGKEAAQPAPGREEAAGAPEELPPLDNMGVEITTRIELGIDYLEFTIYADREKSLELYKDLFEIYLGELQLDGSTRHYEQRYINGRGFYMGCSPKINPGRSHSHITLPGKTCQEIPFDFWRRLFEESNSRGIRLKCTRIDIRADYCNFTPQDFYMSIHDGKARMRALPETLQIIENPKAIDEKGGIGTATTYIGSRKSERYMRVYNLHGYTRLELESKDKIADHYFYYLLFENEQTFNDRTMGLIQDFIYLDEDYWRSFIDGHDRAFMKILPRPDPTLERLDGYLRTQAATALYLLTQIKGEEYIQQLLDEGRQRLPGKTKYYPLMHAYGLEIE